MEFTFNDFQKRAKNKSLSKWEKIGFPDSYRKNLENDIFADIAAKTRINDAQSILDIGCGCSELVDIIIEYSLANNQSLFLVDSDEMLSNIEKPHDKDSVTYVAGRFPDKNVISELENKTFDVIIVYSVLQYVFIDQSIYGFIHECIKLLNSNGRLLIGDVPNFQVKQRFLDSEIGQKFLEKESASNLSINIHHQNYERIDDNVIMSILSRFRNFGCETYLLPQADGLPFANRREDILIIKR